MQMIWINTYMEQNLIKQLNQLDLIFRTNSQDIMEFDLNIYMEIWSKII